MQTPGLFFVTDAPDPAARAHALAEPALAQWQPEDERLPLEVLAPDALLAEPGRLDRGGVVWLVLDRPAESEVYELLGLIDQKRIPALLTRADETRPSGAMQQDGVTLCPSDTSASTACTMLQALASQAELIRTMNNELRLIEPGSGGVADRITRLDEELRFAAQLQAQFLPQQLPQCSNVAISTLWRPAHYVSGDIYDVMRLDENHIGFFLADAVGHGVPAALMTMYIKRSLRTKHIDPAEPHGYRLLDPSETLDQLNRDMIQAQHEKVHFATAVYGVLDCRTNDLTLARAGHPAPMRLRNDADQTTDYLSSEGGLLGVFEQPFEQTTITLQQGDRVLFYSDGFELAFPSYDEQGEMVIATQQYAEAFDQLRHDPPDRALEKLRQRVDEQNGSLNQRDDLTVLCLSANEPATVNNPPADATPTATHARPSPP